ncbi:MAG: adenylate cyclase [Parasphingorhabdus sp.]|jgi:adenylate cyclase
MAIAMRKKMLELEHTWMDSGVENPLKCRMGIITGMCTVGNFGSNDRMDYTIIGGGINLAARLESACAPEQILITYESYAHIKEIIHCEEQETIEVKGITHPVRTFQVVDLYENLTETNQAIHSKTKHLQIDVDLQSMTRAEQREAAKTLLAAASQIEDSASGTYLQ